MSADKANPSVNYPLMRLEIILGGNYEEGFIPDTKRKSNDFTRTMYQAIGSHPAIISKEAFDEVQAERERRSNVIKGSGDAIRKSTRYSSLKSTKAHNQGESAEQNS